MDHPGIESSWYIHHAIRVIPKHKNGHLDDLQ
jgi:hypothetical protein